MKMDISYSMYFDNDDGGGIMSRIPSIWIPDDQVKQCYKCGIKFTYLFRRHHCRSCGRIFCSTCTSSTIYTNQTINDKQLLNHETYYKECLTDKIGNNGYRVCFECYRKLKYIKDGAKLLFIMNRCNLDIKSYYTLRLVSKTWCTVADMYRSILRSIQYMLPTSKLSEQQYMVLMNNIRYISGHSRLLVWLIKSVKWNADNTSYYMNIITSPRNCSCKLLMCRRECSNVLTTYDYIELCMSPQPECIQRMIYQHFIELNVSEIVKYILFLTYAIRFNPIIADILTYHAIKSDTVLIYYYWDMISYRQQIYTEYIDNLLSKLDDTKRQLLSDNHALISQLSKLRNGADYTDKMMNYFYSYRTYKIPINPDLQIRRIWFDNVQFKDSSTAPIIITCDVKSSVRLDNIPNISLSPPKYIEINESPSSCNIYNTSYPRYQFMYKSVDVRRDRLVMSVIRICDCILKANQMDMDIITYNVLATGNKCGLIEIVPDSETIHSLVYGKGMNLQNFILEYNNNDPIGEVRQRFVNSMAAYCIIMYLLGVRDRHLDNIMIHKSGRIFHIDFSYMMGSEPTTIITTPEMRITKEMVDSLGGPNSTYYTIFQDLCGKVYECLRRYDYLIMTLLLYLTAIDNNFNINRLEKEIKNRFLPGEYRHQADISLINNIKSSQSYVFTDFVHEQGKLWNSVVNFIFGLFKFNP
jgi:hypothetical protein